MAAPVLPPITDNLKTWGRELTTYLQRQLPRLYFKTSTDNPAENGVLLWDEANKYPVVSRDGSFDEIVLKQSAPSSSVGSSGDISGMVSWDGSYIYVCTAAHDGTTNIWKRAALTGGAW